MLTAMSSDRQHGGAGAQRKRLIARPLVPPGPRADLKSLIYELYLAADTPQLDKIVAVIDRAGAALKGNPGRDTVARIIGDPDKLCSQADVVAVVTALAREARWDEEDAAARARDMWVAARTAATAALSAHQAPAVDPGELVRVAEADLRRLGVHATIAVPGVLDEMPPEYVARDADDQVRAKVTAAAARGGFVLLIGDSSVGKTRCVAEAVKAVLPDWRLVHPAGPSEAAALTAEPLSHLVVWLDELQRYLGGEYGLTGGVVRALLNAPHPAVIIGTLWTRWYNPWTTMPGPDSTDPHAREREVLDLADVIRIAPELSAAEQGRARAAAARDRRLAVALGTDGYGLTQTLAAAPQLVTCWENADPYARAVLTAALDAARLGARAPLSSGFLRAAAPGYCTSRQQAAAPENWFEQALAYATNELHGAVVALSPVGTGLMGQVAGYTVADYLIQHVSRERHYERAPASTWDAIDSHIRDPADAAWLAESARNRLLYRYAIPLYRRAADGGHWQASELLADLLIARGDQEGAVQVLRADAGNVFAAAQLASLLAERGDLDGLRTRADAGDWAAPFKLALVLAERRDFEGLRARADAGDELAAWLHATVMAGRGDLDGLRARADAGDGAAASHLASLLATRGDLQGASHVLRARADAGDLVAAKQLADLLAKNGDLDGAVQVLRARVEAGDTFAVSDLAGLLARCDDVEELRIHADAGHPIAAAHLASVLVKRGDVGGLRARADAGDEAAASQLASVLVKRGDVGGLRARANAGDGHAARQLASLLTARGDLDGATQILRARADAGDEAAASQLASVLVKRGDVGGLRARADAGDGHAARQLASLLVERGDLDALRAR